MSQFPQMLLDLNEELIVDLFAGGGGASAGIEMALGRQVDHAINHDEDAVSMHRANHPQTLHHTSDVFEVDPHEITQGRPVGILWASPDCTDHSKAKGGKPIRTTKRRALAWVVVRWCGQVRPRMVYMENVEEFVQWGPLVAQRDRETGRVVRQDRSVAAPGERTPFHEQALTRDDRRKGERFKQFVQALRGLGYEVEWREMKASDYGAPTTRNRLFIIARCDGKPIVWPEPTHGEGSGLKPVRTAADCIDWSIPMLSIFATRKEAREWGRAQRKAGWRIGTPNRPLAKNTLKRIAAGVVRFVLEAAEPFVVSLAHGDSGGRREYSTDEPLKTQHAGGNKFGVVSPVMVPIQNYGWGDRTASLEDPLRTITASPKGGGFSLAAPYLVPRYGEREGQAPRTMPADQPHPTVVPRGNGAQLVTAFIAKHYGDTGQRPGSAADEPVSTITTSDHNALVAAHVTKFRTGSVGHEMDEPLHTITASSSQKDRGGAAAPLGVVAAHIQRDFGTSVGHAADEPLRTITADGGGKAALVATFLQKYYGCGLGQAADEPMHTITTKDRLGLVTVMLAGIEHVLVDIAMRMFWPHELYAANGFRHDYIIDRGHDGREFTKEIQVRLVGNSVPPQFAEAIARANAPELTVRDETRKAS